MTVLIHVLRWTAEEVSMLPLAPLIQIGQMICVPCLQTQLLPAIIPALATNLMIHHFFISVNITIQALGVPIKYASRM